MREGTSGDDDARVRLLVREPRRVFCFWDVGPGSLALLRRAGGEREQRLTRLAIRLLSERLSVHVVLPGPPAEGSGSSYLDVPLPGPTSAELGWFHPSGRFSALARSNSVDVPAARLSPEAAAMRVRFPIDPGHLAALTLPAGGPGRSRGYGEIRVRLGGGTSDSFG